MGVLDDAEWEACLLEPVRNREVERASRRSYGIVTPATRYLANSPWLSLAFAGTNFRKRQLRHLDVRLAELVFLAVSQDNSCRHCYEGQRLSLRVQGFSEDDIRRLEEASFEGAEDRRIKRALDFARRLSRALPPPGPQDRAALREAGHSDDAIREIAYMAAYTAIANRCTTLPAISNQGLPDPDSFLVRVLGPLIARLGRGAQHPGPAEPLDEEHRAAPFAYVALALDGLPVGRVLADFCRIAWDSARFSKRAQGMAYAVVARGLGSARAEAEAKRLLAGEGLDEAKADEILAHLGGADLDPVEAALVPFARETIRYRPQEIQRRARALRDTIGVEAFTDAVGVTSLANGVCRLSLTLCED